MKNALSPLLAVLALFGAATSSATTVFWVAPGGDDAAAGTQERPFATVARAVAALREHTAKGLRDDVAIRLRAGVHRFDRTLELTPAELGDGTHAVTFTAPPGERAILSGARALDGEWRLVRENLWRLEIPAARAGGWVFRSLFRGEVSLPRAREPDEGFYTVAAVEDERRRLRLHQPLPAPWADLAGVELNTTAHWHFNRQPVAAIGPDFVQARRGIGTDVSSARITVKSHSRVWLENALAFADTPGEWFLDPADGALYLATAPGEDPNRARFTAPVLRELVVVRGSPERLVRNLHFRGVEFAETDWELPAEGRLGVQAGAWAFDRGRTFSPGAALRFGYCAQTSVQNCRFRELGDGAITFEIGASDALVARCEFSRVGSNVIQVGRMPEYTGVGHPLHRDFALPRDFNDAGGQLLGAGEVWRRRAALVPEAPARIVVTDSSFLDCGHLDYGSVAVGVGYAHHVTIEHNLYRRLPYTAISVGWRWAPGLTNCHSHLIRRNRIESIMLQAGDGGGIYLVGEQPGTRVLENYIHDSGRNYWSHGIYPDECSDHMEIAGNYVTGVMDHSIFMNKNGPNQQLRDNNGEPGTTVVTGHNEHGGKWVNFSPARPPPDLSLYGPRGERSSAR